MSDHWFTTTSIEELQIFAPERLAKPDSKASPALVVRDKAFIKRLMERIKSIDPDGSLMKKPGPDTEVFQLAFCSSGKPADWIQFFNGCIKTPSTGFHAAGPPEGLAIYEELLGLLNPEVGKILPLVVDTPLAFPDFTFRPRGTRVPGPVLGPPRTGSGQTNEFEVSWDEKSLVLDIYSGQTPPAPKEFLIRGVTYRLLTYQTPEGKYLYPHYFLLLSS